MAALAVGPGGGDNAMASLGLSMGVGDVSISLGTSGVAAAISPVPAYDMTASVTGFADCTGHWLPLACTINGSRISDAGRAALGVGYDELAELARPRNRVPEASRWCRTSTASVPRTVRTPRRRCTA